MTGPYPYAGPPEHAVTHSSPGQITCKCGLTITGLIHREGTAVWDSHIRFRHRQEYEPKPWLEG